MNKYFPRISRRITEPLGFVLLVVFFVLLAVSIKNIKDYRSYKEERVKIVREVEFWKNMATQKPDYRDAYLKIAILEYRLGETDQAKLYLEKALILDPNFEKGKEFQKILEK